MTSTELQQRQERYGTVDDLIKELQDISAEGKGHYCVTVNSGEYRFMRKDVPTHVDVDDEEMSVDIGA